MFIVYVILFDFLHLVHHSHIYPNHQQYQCTICLSIVNGFILSATAGVFNCIIYVRPRVQMLQMVYPQDSFTIVLRVAISKTGVPDEIEVIRAKLYGREYSRPEKVVVEQSPEDHDDPGKLIGLPIPSVVAFESNVEVSTRSLVSALGVDDDKESTQINNTQKHESSC